MYYAFGPIGMTWSMNDQVLFEHLVRLEQG